MMNPMVDRCSISVARHCISDAAGLQEECWTKLLSQEQLSQLQQLWTLSSPGGSSTAALDVTDSHAVASELPILKLLTRIEDPQFIHVLTLPLSQDTQCHVSDGPHAKRLKLIPQESLRYYLPRFHLNFELKPGSTKLYSCDYSEYYVASEESLKKALSCVRPQLPKLTQLPLPLLFEHFIVLVADNSTLPVKVLISDAPIASIRALAASGQEYSAFFGPSSSARSMHHHVFNFNPYTGNLDTAVVQSRLYLAALHAACSCALPFPGLAMTGGEHALQLLRQ
jgi:hypothetical protein